MKWRNGRGRAIALTRRGWRRSWTRSRRGAVDWRKAPRRIRRASSWKDRERAKKKMVSLKAGLPLSEVRQSSSSTSACRTSPGDTCPKSGDPLKLRMGKAGLFIACAGYPDCSFTVDIPGIEEDAIDAADVEGQTCEECGSPMKLRTGRTGSAFLGCTAYPACRNTVPVKVAGERPRRVPTSRPARAARTAGAPSSPSTAATVTTWPARAGPPAGTARRSL